MLSPDVENILEIQKKRSLREEQLKEKILVKQIVFILFLILS